MCRWIAYKGPYIPLERYVTSPVHSLIEQSTKARESTGINGDGFGLGWYGFHDEPALYREIRPAWSDENLRFLCRHIQSHLFFAHVRASTGTMTSRPNCHPFIHENWMFMHNGQIGDWSLIRRKVENLIPDRYYPSRLGTTDSEAVFLAILGAGADENPVRATIETLRRIERIRKQSGTNEPIRFTAALSNGADLFCFRYASDETATSLYYRQTPDRLVVVSEPLDHEEISWKGVPADCILIAKSAAKVELLSFEEAAVHLERKELLPNRHAGA